MLPVASGVSVFPVSGQSQQAQPIAELKTTSPHCDVAFHLDEEMFLQISRHTHMHLDTDLSN